MDNIEQALKGMGLNEKEALLYITLLQTGTAPGSALAQRTGIPRSTVHFVGRELAKQGIVSMAKKGSVTVFTAEPPNKLMSLLERERRGIEHKERELQKVMGSLEQLVNPHASFPKVQYYEGKEGMMSLYDSILDMRAPIDSLEESGKVFELFPEYALEWPRKRVERKIPNRCIAPVGSPMNVTNPSKYLEVRYIDPKKYPFTWQIRLCEDLVGIFSFDKQTAVGIGIRHADIAKNFHLLFEYLWASTKPS